MRAALRLLTLVCLIWCALGVAEPEAAHADVPGQHQSYDAGSSDAAPDETDDSTALAGHHHCPVAPILHVPAPTIPATLDAVPLRPCTVAALVSLPRAPPLQPPAA